MKYYQQGDVLLIPVKKIPASIPQIEGAVLQLGEATNHSHRLEGDGFKIYEDPRTRRKHLRVVSPSLLKHEEHKAFIVPAGDYEVRIVREFSHFDNEAREVAD